MTPTPHTLVDEEPDDWLPSGWTVKSKIRHNGKRDRFYFSPSGQIFNSKVLVCRHLSIDPKTVGSSLQSNTLCVLSNTSAIGSNISTEVSTLTTPEINVSPKLKPVANPQSTPEQSLGQSGGGEYLPGKIYFERVPADGLPPGWIKEHKIQNMHGKIRRDPFFTDPVHGYVFRSMKDTLRYIETGEPGRLAIIPKSPDVVETVKVSGKKRKQQLVDDPARKSNKSTAAKTDGTPPSDHSTIEKSKKKGQVGTHSTKKETEHNIPRRSSGRLTALKEKSEVQITEQNTNKTNTSAEAPKRGYKSPLLMSYEESSWLDSCIDFSVKSLTGKDHLSVHDYYGQSQVNDGNGTSGPPGFSINHVSRDEIINGSGNVRKSVGSGSSCNWARGTDRSLFR